MTIKKKKLYKPKLDRWDISQNLPSGAITKTAKKCEVSVSQVVNVLNGNRRDYHDIIKTLELFAAVNIWKTRFCKRAKSQL